MNLRCLSLLSLAFCLTGTALAEDKPVDVRDVMTASQFHAAGLDKLTPQEMASFNAWLAGYAHVPAAMPVAAPTAAPAPMPAAVVPVPVSVPVPVPTPSIAAAPAAAPAAATTARFGQEMLSPETRNEPVRIESRIVGSFTGWTGDTVFKLENGQVWKQADSSSFETKLDNPAIVIKRLGFGYLLTLSGHGATVFVKRVQ